MSTSKIRISNWLYEVESNDSTGELTVISSVRFNGNTLIPKAIEYAKAEVSLAMNGPVSLEVINQRKAACEGCQGCDKRAEDEWYCEKCGCPKWKRSQLQVKWEMPAATCPIGKWLQ